MSNMVINTNVLSLNSHRSLKMVGTSLSKSSEKLSSGLRINRAADDAAGLAISEKMRSQIRGLNQASRNSQDGISLIQTAEGALQETENMLQRMRELVVQASNDVLEPTDRHKIALELNELSDEIDATAVKTEFNQKKLIDGSWKDASIYFQTGANEGQGLKFNIDQMDAKVLGVTKAEIGEVVSSLVANGATKGTVVNTGDTIFSATAAPANTFNVLNADDLAANVGKYVVNENTSFEITEDGSLILNGFNGFEDGTKINMKDISGTQTYSVLDGNIGTDGKYGEATQLTLTANGGAINLGFVTPVSTGAGANATLPTIPLTVAPGRVDTINYVNQKDPTQSASLTIKYGYDEGDPSKYVSNNNTYTFSGNMTIYATTADGSKPVELVANKAYTAEELRELFNVTDGNGDEFSFNVNGITTTLTVDSEEIASAAMATATLPVKSVQFGVVKNGAKPATGEEISKLTTTLDGAIEKVSAQRAKLGAYQNRLEHTIKNLDVSSENLAASESRIRDTDMAAEMMNLTKANVLSQAATSMLAQANQAPQNILQLLR